MMEREEKEIEDFSRDNDLFETPYDLRMYLLVMDG